MEQALFETEVDHRHLKPKPAGPIWLANLCTVISYVFHPVFMPTLLCIVLWKLQPAAFAGILPKTLGMRLATVVLLTVFFPLVTMLLLRALGFLKNLQMRVAKDRIIPLIATMTFYFWAQQVFSHLPETPKIINILMLGSFWGIILLFLGSIFFKVSMHTTAAGGAMGIMIILLFTATVNMLPALLATIVVAGIVGTARLLLREHTVTEVWLGYAIGLAVQLGAWAYIG
ncbi:MAG: hypothetical protein JST36_06630 [Bacteroidetes bacterium]|nr:hypothetical protein [Bacteroidota bacterium]